MGKFFQFDKNNVSDQIWPFIEQSLLEIGVKIPILLHDLSF